MSNHCQLTGTVPRFGNTISHSHRRTSRRFDPNIQRRTYWAPSLGRTVTRRLSTRAIKTIENDKPIWPHCDALIWPHPRFG
ncbi:50S ribosomal protein L28 [Arsenicicoccus bolidensis]|uniref:50S ribosomal protein L28 n=1 Tax=Arsenicicoccus bolidensis TaxID=229480 RepID=UPI000492D2F9|nr:50S ribosomal protein L28 [Arsenicicoccus bolidensis]